MLFLLQVVAREFVDAKVIEAHIVPQQLLLTSLIPTAEHSTVAWEKGGVKAVLESLPELWEEDQYTEEYNMDTFIKNLHK